MISPTTVVYDDLQEDKRYYVFFEEEQFDRIDALWEIDDEMLAELRKNSLFANVKKWKDMKPVQYKVLLIKGIDEFVKLSEEEQTDEENPVVVTLRFFITGFLKSLYERADLNIDLLRIQRYDRKTVSFSIDASLSMTIEFIEKEKLGPKLVVDNTKEDE